ncbi:MAG: alpha-D-ribose 1-methylphosphonate 5-triphosphate diphosphatase [Afipia sp. 62-7]|nr:alpha-D-ribose 1-methylphosphonate 5-triphosphate diphosphatase [Afipia sp.]OJU21899.1 MAG: alpha-D-ribose 1-methylphosphonate 5-triphosphate diphosphatase [Afipia sp. 62-7]
MRIVGGQVLQDGALIEGDLAVDEDSGLIAADGHGRVIDARGLHVLPGIVDIHGDAFERQIMPRPGVGFPIDVALKDSDRQCIGNGITTVFHGVTCSWEPGLRGIDNARTILETIEANQASFAADTRFHLRHETYNLEAEQEVTRWVADGRVGMLAFNDHLPGPDTPPRARKVVQMAERAGLSENELNNLVTRLQGLANEVPGAIARLAAAADKAGTPTLSHDDMSPEQRRWFRDLNCRVAEFPTTVETAQDAVDAGDDIVLGAPNVVRGGSHIGWIGAAEMIAQGRCTILASDYYYPAPLLAAYRLAADGIVTLPQAWTYVSERPARAARLADRGVLEQGRRADIVLVDATDSRRPQVVAAICAGQLAYVAAPNRLQ